MAAKVRAHQLAKELGVTSKDMVNFLQAHGVFVRSASSTLETATVRMVREKTAAGVGPGSGRTDDFPPPPPENPLITALKAKLMESSPEFRQSPSASAQDARSDDPHHPTVLEETDPSNYGTVLEGEIEDDDSIKEPDWDREVLEEPSPGRSGQEPRSRASHAPVNDLERTNGQHGENQHQSGPASLPAEPAVAEEDVSFDAGNVQQADEGWDAPHPGLDGNTGQPPSPRIPSPTELLVPEQGYLEFQRGDKGVSFETLLVPYLVGAAEITITDPYVRTLNQTKNLMELLEALLRAQGNEARTIVRLRTSKDREGDPRKDEAQKGYLDRLQSAFKGTGLTFTYTLEPDLHGRTIVADSGWRITLDRGLDIFDRVPLDPLHLAHRMQEYRKVRSFYVSYHALQPKNQAVPNEI